MAYNIISDFFSIVNVSLFDNASILLIICYLIWEVPRSVRIMSEEYTSGLYPEGGRVVDISMLLVGLAAVAFMAMGNAEDIVAFLKKPGITAFFLIIMVVVPLIIFFGFLKRLFPRFEGDSVTVFLTHGFLDLMHTIFYISLSLLAIPTVGYLLLGG
ncbi:hypothetical protein GF318_03930 [Candidatus Micrarchaeota archaeon]|nr:hypothetical protein [Candidatus Micrarchaeota archaeon]